MNKFFTSAIVALSLCVATPVLAQICLSPEQEAAAFAVYLGKNGYSGYLLGEKAVMKEIPLLSSEEGSQVDTIVVDFVRFWEVVDNGVSTYLMVMFHQGCFIEHFTVNKEALAVTMKNFDLEAE
jgi:hypothetical protein